MMRCCKHCGALLEDEAKVCDFCGAVPEIPKVEEPASQVPAEAVTENIPAPAPKKKFYKRKWFIIGCIALALVLAAVAVIACMQISAPMQAIAYYEEILNGDCTHLIELAPMEFWEPLTKEYDSMDECLANLTRYIEAIYKSSERSISAKVVDRELLSKEDLISITDILQERYDISPDRVTSAQQLIIKFVYQYPDDTITSASLLIAIQIDSEWYLWDESRGVFLLYNWAYPGSGMYG